MFSELPVDFEIKHPHDLLSRRILFDAELCKFIEKL
jgi:hypothetical protein